MKPRWDGPASTEDRAMPLRNRKADFSFEVRAAQGAWVWRLANAASDRGIIGAARNLEDAARELCATLSEIGLRDRSVEVVPALFEAALSWNTVFDQFDHAALRERSGAS